MTSLIFGLLLLTEKERSKTKDIAGGCLIAVFVLFLLALVADRSLITLPSKLYPGVLYPTLFATTLSYLYLFEYTRPGWINLQRSILLLSPSLLLVSLFGLSVIFLDRYDTLETWDQVFTLWSVPNVFFRILSTIVYFAYWIGIPIMYRILVTNYRKDVKELYSQEKTDDLHWLGTVIFYYMVIGVIFVLSEITSSVGLKIIYYIAYTIYPVLLYRYAARHQNVFPEETYKDYLINIPLEALLQDEESDKKPTPSFHPSKEVEIEPAADESAIDKILQTPVQHSKEYANYNINEDTENQLMVRFKEHIATKKPYLDSEISLATLAWDLYTNRTYLSNIINSNFGMGFYDFINQCRIEESKQILSDHTMKDKKINEIAQMCGFNNTRTFYRVFQKAENMTPGDFRLKQMKDPVAEN